jgi:hypothetical protein
MHTGTFIHLTFMKEKSLSIRIGIMRILGHYLKRILTNLRFRAGKKEY